NLGSRFTTTPLLHYSNTPLHVRCRNDLPASVRRVRFRSRRLRRIFCQRLHLSAPIESFRQPAAPLLLSFLQNANSMAPESTSRLLAGIAWTLRQLRGTHRFSLFHA